MTNMTQVASTETDSELIPTINPKELTLADWKLIADILEYKSSWAYSAWAKVKGVEFLKALAFDHWIEFARCLGYAHTWATRRYMELKSDISDEKEAV